MRIFRPLIDPRVAPRLGSPRTSLRQSSISRSTILQVAQRRSIFNTARTPLNLEWKRQGANPPIINNVRVHKARLKPSRILMTMAALYILWTLYDTVVFGQLNAVAEQLELSEEEEEEDSAIFIPFPGTTKQLPPKPYMGLDPEWQAFIKFSKDKQGAKKVRDELASIVQRSAEKHPALAVHGGNSMKLRRCWLDVDFPRAGPPEFKRSGIEIGDRIAWTQKPVDSTTVLRTRNILWPMPLFKSVWSFTTVLITDDFKYILDKLGITTTRPPPPSLASIVAKHQELFKGPQLPGKDTPSLPTQPPAGDSKKVISNPPGSEKAPMAGKSTDEEVAIANLDALYSSNPVHSHIIRPLEAFKKKFRQTWHPTKEFAPKGSIMVSGLVELESPKVYLVFDVKAAYDPKAKTYDRGSMQITLRRFQEKKQGPMGRK